MKVIKVLMVTPGLNLCGGIESFCMNYIRQFDANIIVDFAIHDVTDDTYTKEIEKRGGKVYVFPKFKLKTFVKTIKTINSFFKEHHDYDIVHCNMANAALFYLSNAKKYNIKIRIQHSHQNSYADKPSHKIRNFFLVKKGNKYANINFACAKLAGDFLFKNKEYKIIRNAIDLDKYVFNNITRKKMQTQYGITNELVIGNIGRLTEQKNQQLLIKIMDYIVNTKKENAKLFLVGKGHLENYLKELVKKYNLQDKVVFTGEVNNVQDYLQLFDIFVLPSLYEGLGVVNIEAQAAGLPTLVSDKIPKEAYVTELMASVGLNLPASEWGDKILSLNKNRDRESRRNIYIEEIRKNGYDIKIEGKKLEKLYLDLLENGEIVNSCGLKFESA
ncbi:glycosyltransferase [Candidatus Saccharibacteria bacterium]|nr:glycosyltransferase [Candidatus Saccharibacteria bacterium]